MSRSLQNCSSALEHGPRRGGGVPSRNMLPTPCTHANIKAAMSGQELPEGLEDAEDGAEVPEAVRNSDLPALLRACWEGAAFLQFCRLFAAPLKLRAFSAEQLEAALLCPDDHTMFLGELLFKLLRRDTREPYTEKDAYAWEDLLRRKLDAQWPQAFTAHPMQGSDFFSLDPVSRVRGSAGWGPVAGTQQRGRHRRCGELRRCTSCTP